MRPPPIRKFAALLALSGTACTSLQVQSAPTTSVVTERNPRQVTLRLKNGKRVELYDATLKGDSIFGYTSNAKDPRRETRSIAVDDVTEVAVRKFSTVKTVLAVTVMVAAIAIVSGGSGGSTAPSNNGSCQSSSAAKPA